MMKNFRQIVMCGAVIVLSLLGRASEANATNNTKRVTLICTGECVLNENNRDVNIYIKSADMVPSMIAKNAEGDIVFTEPTEMCTVNFIGAGTATMKITLDSIVSNFENGRYHYLLVKRGDTIPADGRLQPEDNDYTFGNVISTCTLENVQRNEDIKLYPRLMKRCSAGDPKEVDAGAKVESYSSWISELSNRVRDGLLTGSFNFGATYEVSITVSENG